MLREEIINPSVNRYASRLHHVPTPDNEGFYPCVDFCEFNVSTVPDNYPVPYIHDLPLMLRELRIFLKICLAKSYFHIPVEEENIHKTLVTTPTLVRPDAIWF